MTNILRVAAAGNRIVSPQAGCNGNTVLISRRSASPPQRRQVCQTENSQSENGPGPDAVELVPETCTPREHVWGPPSQKVLVHLHATVHLHAPRPPTRREVGEGHCGQVELEGISPSLKLPPMWIRCAMEGGTPSQLGRSLTRSHSARAKRPADGGAAGCVLPAPQARAHQIADLHAPLVPLFHRAPALFTGLPLSSQGSRSLHRAPALFTGLSTALNGPVASPP